MEAVSSLRRLTGNPHALYVVANLDELPSKRQRPLPSKYKVYDLLNHLSESSSHHASMETRTWIDRLVGSLVSDEYDLEGSDLDHSDFVDFTLN